MKFLMCASHHIVIFLIKTTISWCSATQSYCGQFSCVLFAIVYCSVCYREAKLSWKWLWRIYYPLRKRMVLSANFCNVQVWVAHMFFNLQASRWVMICWTYWTVRHCNWAYLWHFITWHFWGKSLTLLSLLCLNAYGLKRSLIIHVS